MGSKIYIISISEAAIEGVLETIPTYRSLQVIYDPVRMRCRELIAHLSGILPRSGQGVVASRRWMIPVCYGGEHGMDLEFVAAVHNLTTDEVIRIHSGAEYRVYMIGFAPGFAYLGGLPEDFVALRLIARQCLLNDGEMIRIEIVSKLISRSAQRGCDSIQFTH